MLAALGVELAFGDAGDTDSLRAAMCGVSKGAVILPNGENQLTMEKRIFDVAVECGA